MLRKTFIYYQTKCQKQQNTYTPKQTRNNHKTQTIKIKQKTNKKKKKKTTSIKIIPQQNKKTILKK